MFGIQLSSTHLFFILVFCIFRDGYTMQCPTSEDVITINDVRDAALASSAVYVDDVVVDSIIPDTQFKVIYSVLKQLNSKGEGIRVFVADHGNTRIICYRGTDGVVQLLKEGKSFFDQRVTVSYKNTQVQILKFFWEAFELVSYDLRPYMLDPTKKYILTGHSLGGALASILALNTTFAADKPVWSNPQSSLITFGQPRTGLASYADLHDQVISTFRKLRFVYMTDVVARIPPYQNGFRHHSRAVYMSDGSYIGKKDSYNRVPAPEAYDAADNFVDINQMVDRMMADGTKAEKILSELDVEQDDTSFENKILQDFIRDGENSNDKFEDENEFSLSILEGDDAKKQQQQHHQKQAPLWLGSMLKKNAYWQVCEPKRAYYCITKFGHYVPKVTNHMLSKYLASITNTRVFFSLKNAKESSFKDALIESCKEENTK